MYNYQYKQYNKFNNEEGKNMSIKLNGYKLSDNSIKMMKNVINKSEKEGRELGFSLCKRKDSDMINPGPRELCIGERRCVYVPTICREDENNIGLFHTHPTAKGLRELAYKVLLVRPKGGYESKMSIDDLFYALDYGIGCLGYTKSGRERVKCHVRKRDYGATPEDVRIFDEADKKMKRLVWRLDTKGMAKLVDNLAKEYFDIVEFDP